LRSAKRSSSTPGNRNNDRGFRIALKKIETGRFGALHSVPSANDLEMIWVEPGTFMMGSPPNEKNRIAEREEQRSVTLPKGFYLGKYEVTQAQYKAVMTDNGPGVSATPSEWPNNPNRPVENVSWTAVQIFIARLNGAEIAAGRLSKGWSYALPTEAEWEYACRAGTTTAYHWGNEINPTNANYGKSQIGQTAPVGQYAPNSWGFYDMHGNVWEWTADKFNQNNSHRVLRGGSFQHDNLGKSLPGINLRSAWRSDAAPGMSGKTLGFRLALRKTN